MRFFKYIFFSLFILFFLLFSFQSHAACEPDVYGSFSSNLADPPYQICAHHTQFGSEKCVMLVDNMQKTSTGWTLFAKTTGSTCNNVTKLNEEPEQYDCKSDVCPVTEAQPCPSTHEKGYYNGVLSCVKKNESNVLNCTSEVCNNPENKICPEGYTSGNINGSNVCVKSKLNEEVECADGECGSEDVIKAINEGTGTVQSGFDRLIDTITNGFENILNKLNNLGNNNSEECTEESCNESGSNLEEESSNEWGQPDLSAFDVEVPIITVNDKRLSDKLFTNRPSCPADNKLSLNFMGRTYTHNFSYTEICNTLEFLGYILLALAYVYAAHIVVKA